MPSLPLCILLTFLYTLWLWSHRKKAYKKGLILPPGPKKLPIIGNCLSFPAGERWLVFDAWLKKYGDIISFELLGQHFVVLGSLKRTNDLFGKRSSIYSSRRMSSFMRDVLNYDFIFFNLPYGAAWRHRRRAFHEHFNCNAIQRYHPNQLRETRALLRNLLKNPDKFLRYLRFQFVSVIMDVVFGIQIQSLDDPYVLNAEETAKGFSHGAIFGNSWVDYAPFLIPVMKYVPSWMPGAGYKKNADRWRAAGRFVEYCAFENVKNDLVNGIDRSCIVSRLLESLADDNAGERTEAEAMVRSISATTYFAAADSTISACSNFFFAIMRYPEVQKRAHAEIDHVVGPNRLPDFGDRDSLPYINAIVKEVMRWKLVVPNIEHESTEDDEYDGYFIPKGTIVIGNSWSVLHDPEIYNNPEEFSPERFLNDGVNAPDPDPNPAFGYGRRICPGRHFSDSELFITIASVLAVFTISPPTDESSDPVDIDHHNGLLSFPRPLSCMITPRSPEAEALILATV